MKNFKTLVLTAMAGAFIAPISIFAQEEETSAVSIDGGFDMYTSYIWRGSKFGSGPAFQPWVEMGVGGLSLGAWGSASAGSEEALEMDLYLGYSFDFGLGITLTDYYFGGDYVNSVNHFLEPSISYEIGGFSLMGAYLLYPGSAKVVASPAIPGSNAMIVGNEIIPAVEAMEAVEGSDATSFGEDADIYIEAGYSFKNVSLAVGAGNGAYVAEDDDFTICNITVGTSKDIEITDKFALPLSASVTLNPSTGGFFITAGVSF